MKLSRIYFLILLFGAISARAAFTDADWVSLPGINGYMYAITVDASSNVYIAGQFTKIGDTAASCVAKWDGTNWSALGTGLAGGDPGGPAAYALAVTNGVLYVGGDFATAGGVSAYGIAKWDGTNWSALGGGISGAVSQYTGPNVAALCLSGNTLYVGGQFTNADGVTANNIASWDGTNWSALGLGVGGFGDGTDTVNAFAAAGQTLYVGGLFSMAGANQAYSVAQWDGTRGAHIDAMTIFKDQLIIGGEFTNSGSTALNRIGRWDGTNWSQLGSGISANRDAYILITALATSGDKLYAGGSFSIAGGSPVNNIASWDGANWSAMGSGVSGTDFFTGVYAFAFVENNLYGGGDFSMAGTNAAQSFAEAIIVSPVTILTTDGNFGVTNGAFGFNLSGPSGSNVIIQASANLQSWTSLQTNQLNSNGLFYFSDPQPPSNIKRFYRAQLSP